MYIHVSIYLGFNTHMYVFIYFNVHTRIYLSVRLYLPASHVFQEARHIVHIVVIMHACVHSKVSALVRLIQKTHCTEVQILNSQICFENLSIQNFSNLFENLCTSTMRILGLCHVSLYHTLYYTLFTTHSLLHTLCYTPSLHPNTRCTDSQKYPIGDFVW